MVTEQQGQDQSRALVPVRRTEVIPVTVEQAGQQGIDWEQLIKMSVLVAAGISVAFIETKKNEARQHVRAEFDAELLQENSPLAQQLDSVEPNQYPLFLDLAAATYLSQPLPEALEAPQGELNGFVTRMRAGVERTARRGVRAADTLGRKAASGLLAAEAHKRAEEQGITIQPLRTLAEVLGAQAFGHRDQHPQLP